MGVKFSPWIHPSVAPVRDGVYQLVGGVYWARFADGVWHCCAPSLAKAAEVNCESHRPTPKERADDPASWTWRGLAQEPKP